MFRRVTAVYRNYFEFRSCSFYQIVCPQKSRVSSLNDYIAATMSIIILKIFLELCAISLSTTVDIQKLVIKHVNCKRFGCFIIDQGVQCDKKLAVVDANLQRSAGTRHWT